MLSTRSLLLAPPALALCAVAVYGMLATLEPMPADRAWLWRAVYLALGLAGVTLLVFALASRRHRVRNPKSS